MAMAACGRLNQTGRVHEDWNTTCSQLGLHVPTFTATCVPDLQMNASSLKWWTHYSELMNTPQTWTVSVPNTEQKVTSLTTGNSGAWVALPQHAQYPAESVFPKQKQSVWPKQSMQNCTWAATLSEFSFLTGFTVPCLTHP